MPKELTSFHHLRPRLSSCTGRGTRHALPADCCASAMPGHTAAARATKVRDPGVAWCLLRTRMIRCTDPDTLRPSPTLIMDRHVHTRRLLWVRLAVLKARRLLPVYHNTETISVQTLRQAHSRFGGRVFLGVMRGARAVAVARSFVGLVGGVALSHASRISASNSFFDSFVICTITCADLPHINLRNMSGAASNKNCFRSSGRCR